ncbi:MAG: ROK family protein [Phycisphaerales bacterium]|nr:ROK family protein [Phycisphaerales bacterium]
MLTGVDLGGTKIEAAVMTEDGRMLACNRVPTPHGNYEATVSAIASLVHSVEEDAGGGGEILGIGIPGSESPDNRLIRNSNSTALNGRPLASDLTAALNRPILLANDANCLAMSESHDGAAAGARSCFAIILGTGVGGGVIIDGHLVSGVNGIAGEWGHNPLPWPDHQEDAGPKCWCGRMGCLETWLSGPAVESDWIQRGEQPLAATDIATAHPESEVMLSWLDRLARATAVVINIMDPEVIVVGGGLNAIEDLYTEVPRLWPRWVFSDQIETRLVPAAHGDSSGVRGASRLPLVADCRTP